MILIKFVALSVAQLSEALIEKLGCGTEDAQEMTKACKRLTENCIICWNYLYLLRKFEEIEDAASSQVFLDAVAHGPVISWQHINLLSEYDFQTKYCRITPET